MPGYGDPTTYYRICSDVPLQAPIGECVGKVMYINLDEAKKQANLQLKQQQQQHHFNRLTF